MRKSLTKVPAFWPALFIALWVIGLFVIFPPSLKRKPHHHTWTIVQHVITSACTGSSATCPITVTSTGTGHLLVVAAGVQVASTTITGVSGGQPVGATPSGGWIFPSGCNGSDSGGKSVSCAYVLSSIPGATTITVTRSNSTSGAWRCEFWEVSFTGGLLAYDTSGSADNSSNSTSPSGVTLTIGGSNDAIFQFIDGSAPTAVSSAYNTAPDFGGGMGAAYLINSTSGTAPTWTQTNAHSVVGAIAFKELTTSISYVGGCESRNTSGSSLSCTYSPIAGNTIVFVFTCGGTGSSCSSITVADNNSNALTLQNTALGGTSPIVDVYIFTGTAVTGATSYKVSFSGTPNAFSDVLGEYAGVNSIGASPNGTACSTTGTTSSGATYTATTDAANDWIVGGLSTINSSAEPSTGIMRQQATSNPQTALVDNYSASAGSLTIAIACDVSCSSEPYAGACVELEVPATGAIPGFDKRKKLQRLGVLGFWAPTNFDFWHFAH